MTDGGAKLTLRGVWYAPRGPIVFFSLRGALGAMRSAIIRPDHLCHESLPIAKEYPMKLPSLALLAAFALAGSAIAQTPSQSSPAPSAAPPAQSSASGKIDKGCKKEIHELCGHAHGQEMTDCVKAGLDMNKFTASCKSEIQAHGAPKEKSST